MAHHTLQLAARLSILFAARTAFEMEDFHLPQSHFDDGDWWFVAWAELEFCNLGRAAWRSAGPRARLANVAWEPAGKSRMVGPHRAYYADVPVRLLLLD